MQDLHCRPTPIIAHLGAHPPRAGGGDSLIGHTCTFGDVSGVFSMFRGLERSRYVLTEHQLLNLNPLTAKLFNLNFRPLEVVSR